MDMRQQKLMVEALSVYDRHLEESVGTVLSLRGVLGDDQMTVIRTLSDTMAEVKKLRSEIVDAWLSDFLGGPENAEPVQDDPQEPTEPQRPVQSDHRHFHPMYRTEPVQEAINDYHNK